MSQIHFHLLTFVGGGCSGGGCGKLCCGGGGGAPDVFMRGVPGSGAGHSPPPPTHTAMLETPLVRYFNKIYI